MRYLTAEEILRLHYQVVKDYGGSHGVRDEARIKALVEAPQQSFGDKPQPPSVYDKAAVYLRNLIADHPFVDGNKRTAVTVAGIFLLRNGRRLSASPKQLEDFAVFVATNKPAVPKIAAWLKRHSR